ncbi:hypothetical protein Leucomu_02045 [Leucobacter muris]|uniref:AAA+ ATPase domain-containing protein n=1 Tax=Leucobacter muris TaxID=1935379 RepID=A0ABX5QCU2_9MICO|nr:hypothetical protein [Leucobacter muris]QAB16874.1 hypothetical protein Leucomu_02045 [Leucobacter muris]
MDSTAEPILVTGPHGSGKTYLLRSLSALLTGRDAPHVLVSGSSQDGLQRIEQMPPGALALFDDYELASYEVLQAMARHIADGGKVVATVTEAHIDTGYGERMRRLYELFPEVQPKLERTRSVRLEPFTDAQIARLVHRASSEPISSVTVEAIQQLSWGLPGAALTLLQLHRSGSLSSTPRPRITRTRTVDLHLAALHHPVRVAEAQLTSEQIAAAIVLSEIGPRSRSGIADVFGSSTQSRLFDSGFLLPHPRASELFGVPELYAAAVRNLTTADALGRLRRTTAMHLLSQEVLGIPLPDREAIFCARVLSRHDRSAVHDPLLEEHHARFLQRIIDDSHLLRRGRAGARPAAAPRHARARPVPRETRPAHDAAARRAHRTADAPRSAASARQLRPSADGPRGENRSAGAARPPLRRGRAAVRGGSRHRRGPGVDRRAARDPPVERYAPALGRHPRSAAHRPQPPASRDHAARRAAALAGGRVQRRALPGVRQ